MLGRCTTMGLRWFLVACGLGMLLLPRVFEASAQNISAVAPWHAPLNFKQRQAREEYFFNRQGLQFGLPQNAYLAAIVHARQMGGTPSAETAAQAPAAVAFSWKAIGPLPMLNNFPNFGGFFTGGVLSNSTGRISALAADPQKSGRVFVGTAGGGVWMTADGGTTFKPIFDSEPTQAIGAIALNPKTTPTTIYVATGEGNGSFDSYYGQGIFKSTDLGNTWTQLGSSHFAQLAITSLAIDTTQNPPHLFAGVTSGSSASRADAAFTPGNLMNQGLWRSTDGGTTWAQYSSATFGCDEGKGIPCPAEDVVIDPNQPLNVYVGIQFDNVFRSTDGGNTWMGVTFPGIPAGLNHMGRQSLAVANNPAGTVYAMLGAPDGAEYVGFFKSTDSGANWTAETVSTVNLGGIGIDGTSAANSSQSFYDQALLVLPSDATGNSVYFGGLGPYISTNSGATWTFIANAGGTHTDQHAVAANPFANTQLFIGNDGGFYAYNSTTGTWSQLNSQISAGQIQGIGPHPTNNSSLIAGFQDNGTQFFTGSNGWSVAGGSNANNNQTGDGGFALFDQVNPLVAYHTFASTSSGGNNSAPAISVTTDGGTTWNDSSTETALLTAVGNEQFSFYPPLAVDPTTTRRIFIGGAHIWVSTDAMNTWQKQETTDLTAGCGSLCALSDLEFVPTNHAMAWALSQQSGTDPFKLWNTTQATSDTGATWTEVDGNLPAGITTGTQATGIAVDANNPDDAYLSLSGFFAVTHFNHLFRSTDFGAHWTIADGNPSDVSPPPPTGLPDVPVTRALVDRSDSTGNTILAGTDIGVFRSTDGGSTWSNFNLGTIPAVAIFDLEQNQNNVIFAGTHGRGAYQLSSSAATPTPTSVPTGTPTGAPTGTPMSTPTASPLATPTAAPTPSGSVTVTSIGSGSGVPGQTLAAGTFTISNTSGTAETISTVTIAFSHPTVFSSATLTSGASTGTATPPGTSTPFAMSPPVVIPAGSNASFALKVTIALIPVMLEHHGVAYAGMLAPLNVPRGVAPLSTALGVVSIGLILVTDDKRRRRVILIFAVVFLFAFSAAGCGGSNRTVLASSQLLSSVQPGSFSPLPAPLGTLKVSL